MFNCGAAKGLVLETF